MGRYEYDIALKWSLAHMKHNVQDSLYHAIVCPYFALMKCAQILCSTWNQVICDCMPGKYFKCDKFAERFVSLDMNVEK